MDHCLPETVEAGGRPRPITRAARAVATAIAGAISEVWADLSRAAMNRRVLVRLSMLSERELKDIGLTPQDVADAAVPGHDDAVSLLVGRRDERRRARAGMRR